MWEPQKCVRPGLTACRWHLLTHICISGKLTCIALTTSTCIHEYARCGSVTLPLYPAQRVTSHLDLAWSVIDYFLQLPVLLIRFILFDVASV